MIKCLEARLGSRVFGVLALAFVTCIITACFVLNAFANVLIIPLVGEPVVRTLFWGGSRMLFLGLVGVWGVSMFGDQDTLYNYWCERLMSACALSLMTACALRDDFTFLSGNLTRLIFGSAVCLTYWAWHLIYVFGTVGTEHGLRLSWKQISLFLLCVVSAIYFWVPEGALVYIIQRGTPGHPEFVGLFLWSARFALMALGAFYVWCARQPLVVQEPSSTSEQLATP